MHRAFSIPILPSRQVPSPRHDTSQPDHAVPLTPQKPAGRQFLPLPVELRCQIYSYFTPIHGYHTEFWGILGASKATRKECQEEVALIMGKMLDKINDDLVDQKYDLTKLIIPNSLGPVPVLTVEISGCVFPFPMARYRVGEAAFLAPAVLVLLQLHLCQITIQILDFPASAHGPGWAACEMLHDLDLWINGQASAGAIASVASHFEEEATCAGPPHPVVAIKTRSLVILWKHPDGSRKVATRRHEHYVICQYTREFTLEEKTKRDAGEFAVTSFNFDVPGRVELRWPL